MKQSSESPHRVIAKYHHALSKMLHREGEVEVEARLGVYHENGRFEAGVGSRESFSVVLERCDLLGIEPVRSQTRVDWTTHQIRRITNESTSSVVFQRKERLGREDVKELGIRYSSAAETDVPPSAYNPGVRPVYVRHRQRLSYTIPKGHRAQPAWYGLRIDLTVVRQESKIVYEVEVERVGKIGAKQFASAALTLLAWSQDTQCGPNIMQRAERPRVIKMHNVCFGVQMCTLYEKYRARPVSLLMSDLCEVMQAWAITPKLDGVRKSVLIMDSGMYLCSPPQNIVKIGRGIPKLHGTLIDGEYVRLNRKKRTFYAFDVLFHCQHDVRSEGRAQRQEILQNAPILAVIHEALASVGEVQFRVKKFQTGHFYDAVRRAFDDCTDYERRGISCDGLIFEGPAKYGYASRKWKPPGNQSIDFLLAPHQGDDFKMLVSDGPANTSQFSGTPHFVHNGLITVPGGRIHGRKVGGLVVECVVRSRADRFTALKIRDDRLRPNAAQTARNVWIDINMPILRDTVAGIDMTVFRRLCNDLKFSLLEQFTKPGDTLLDIGCGRGGDLHKWKRLALGRVWAVDPDATNIKEFKIRHQKIFEDVARPLINIVRTKFEVIEDLTIFAADTVAAFFSLTFFAENEAVWTKMIHGIAQCVPLGGHLVGIVQDGHRTRQALGRDPAFITHSFTLSCESKLGDNPQFGDKICLDIGDATTMVKSQIEYLFYFNLFERDLKRYGFTLQQSQFLDQIPRFDSLPPASQKFAHMVRTFVFQKS